MMKERHLLRSRGSLNIWTQMNADYYDFQPRIRCGGKDMLSYLRVSAKISVLLTIFSVPLW